MSLVFYFDLFLKSLSMLCKRSGLDCMFNLCCCFKCESCTQNSASDAY